MAKSAFTAITGCKNLLHIPFYPGDRADYQLRNTLASRNGEWFLAQVDKKNVDNSSVIGVDCTRRIDHGYSEFTGETASWPHLRFVTCGN
jgi:hypothetical protein